MSYSDLSIYDLFAMITCFVWKAKIRKCFDVLGPCSIRILFQTF